MTRGLLAGNFRTWGTMVMAAGALAVMQGCATPPPKSDSGNVDAGAVYAVATSIWAPPNNWSSFLTTTDDVAKATEIPGDAGIEFPNQLGLFGIPKSKIVYANKGATLVRYKLGTDGKLVQDGAPVSFDTKGVTSISSYPGVIQFVSETRAYYFDDRQFQIIVWNPKDMTLDSVIPLAAYARAGWKAVIATSAVKRGTDILFTVSYYNSTSPGAVDSTDKTVALGILDTTNNTVSAPVQDTRCAYTAVPVVMSNGDIYYSSEVAVAAIEYLDSTKGGPSCALRVKAGAREFDKDFVFKFQDVTNAPAGTLFPGVWPKAYVRVLDTTKVTTPKPATASQLLQQPVWSWKQINLADPTSPATAVANTGPNAARVLDYEIDGKHWTNDTSADLKKTTLLDLSADGGAARGITVTGSPFGILRLQ